jgi:tRNA dimethylallyltransferase
MDLKSKIILISGPTASGKSNFSIKLAKKINGEIINADSMQVYKELKILSAKPNPKDYQKIKHHLYGFHSVKKNFSTGDWLKNAIKKIKEVKGRKKIPIFVGGTGLYFKALTDGLVSIPNIPIRYRNNIRDLQKKLGQKKFYQKLLKLDPKSKDKINPTDTQRSIRAYEVKQFTKKSLHEWFENTKSYFNKDDFFKIYIDYPREDLIQRIHKRADQMIKMGAIREVKRFIELKVRKDKSVNKAIGINEIKEYLKKTKDLSDVIEKISIKTRQYAKRQSTWARGHMVSWLKLTPNDLNKFLKKIK